MKQFFIRGFLIILALRLATGCATIVHGSSQKIDIASSPDDAEVWIDGARVGKTPARITLTRGDSHIIKVQKEGFKDVTLNVNSEVSAWLLGNVIFGGIIGCGIDFISGGAYVLTPERIDINLSAMAQLEGASLEIHTSKIEELKELRLLDGDGNAVVVAALIWID